MLQSKIQQVVEEYSDSALLGIADLGEHLPAFPLPLSASCVLVLLSTVIRNWLIIWIDIYLIWWNFIEISKISSHLWNIAELCVDTQYQNVLLCAYVNADSYVERLKEELSDVEAQSSKIFEEIEQLSRNHVGGETLNCELHNVAFVLIICCDFFSFFRIY